MPKTRIWSLLLLVAAVAAAAPATAKSRKTLPVLNVVPRPAAGAVTRTVGPAGGTVQVKTKQATVTLSIPARALGQDTQVTMTPLAAVKRVPFKRGIVGAVELGPEGTMFLKPARLTFRPRKRVPLRLQTPFSASGAGKSFHVYPGRRSRLQLTLPLFHFSVYGEGKATAHERARESHRRQSDPQSQSERDLAQARTDEAIALALLPRLTNVAAEVKAAAGDETRALDALDDALSAAEELRLYDFSSEVLPPHMGDQIPKTVNPITRSRLQRVIREITTYFPEKILDNALARLSQRCAAEHQPALADGILAVEEYRRLFGVSDEVDLRPVKECLTFELDVDSEFHMTGQRLNAEVHVQAKVPLRPGPDLSYWNGTGPIKYLSLQELVEPICSYTWSASGTLYVGPMQVVPGKVDRRFHVVEPMRVTRLGLTLPATQEKYSMTCPGVDTIDTESMWLSEAWDQAHQDELPLTAGIDGWSAESGAVAATKTYSRSFMIAGAPWVESTTLRIVHTPAS